MVSRAGDESRQAPSFRLRERLCNSAYLQGAAFACVTPLVARAIRVRFVYQVRRIRACGVWPSRPFPSAATGSGSGNAESKVRGNDQFS